MNYATTYCLASREIYALLRYGLLLPKITNPSSSRSSLELFAKILRPPTNQYPHKKAMNVPYPLASP
jgi:hypothetical protein